MATLAAIEMLDWLGLHQFLKPDQADELRPLMAGFPDAHAFAKELLRRDWLTPYQINQVLQGKHEQLVLGGYRLRERLGEGAMGQIFKAWNLRLERIVAVKTIHKEYVNSPNAMERFRREVETAAQLDHPNIVLVRDADTIDGRPFLVMDFIDGVNLALRVKQQGALPIQDAVEYARQAALGLQHAHERGIVHRDIKPSNLLLTTANIGGASAPLVKILDFGIARFESEREDSARLTQVGNLLGTIDYIAPEQAQSARTADIRADIYSLGCTLFYLLTARPAFLGDTVVERLGPRLTGEPPSVRAARPEVPAALDELLRKLMARHPDDRLRTPIEVAQALQPFAIKGAAPRPTGVVTAQPVAADAIVAGAVLLATPLAAEPAPMVDSSFLGMTASGRDLSTGAAAATPTRPKASQPFSLKLIVALGGGALLFFLVACLGLCMLSSDFGGPPRQKVGGSIRITNAKFQTPSQTIKAGETKRILVYLERTDCQGPIKLSLEDLPAGVVAKTGMIGGNTLEGDISFTVSYGTNPLETPIRVIAESAKDGARAEKTLTLKIVN